MNRYRVLALTTVHSMHFFVTPSRVVAEFRRTIEVVMSKTDGRLGTIQDPAPPLETIISSFETGDAHFGEEVTMLKGQ